MGRLATLAALLLAAHGLKAQNLAVWARELARNIGPSDNVSLDVRNLSRMAPADVAEVRHAIENELRSRVNPRGAAELRITISENLTSYVLVAELRRGEERRVWILPLSRLAAAVAAAPSALSVSKKLLLENSEPILDVAVTGEDLLVLLPTRLLLNRGHASAPIPARVWPRDLRGRLVVQGSGYMAWLPGVMCRGTTQPLAIDCRDGDEPWPLALPAMLAPGRNYFEKQPAPPFYSAASAGGALIMTGLDGRAQVQPGGPLPGWGSDIAGLAIRCGEGALVLATRPGDAGEPDAVQVYQVANGGVAPAGPPVELPGPVTALWPAGDNSATAVCRHSGTGQYEAYALTISCGN